MDRYWTFSLNGTPHLLARLHDGDTQRVTAAEPTWKDVPNLFAKLVLGDDNTDFDEVSHDGAAAFLRHLSIDPSILDDASKAA